MKKTSIRFKKAAAVSAVIAIVVAVSVLASAGKPVKDFGKSLHKTGAGMKYWYEGKNGLKTLTGVKYEKAGCVKCHANKCSTCHTENLEAANARDEKNCVKCHEGHAMSASADDQGDLHKQMGMGCVDCHVANGHDDVHGDGVKYEGMNMPGAVKTKCTDCHQLNKEVRAHKVHAKNIDCVACHISATTACNNCHIDGFTETGKKEGNYMPAKSWTMLINYKGKVTAATAMTVVAKNKKFVAYGPYFSHNVQAQAKDCKDCHANEAMKLIAGGKKVPMNPMVNGKVQDWKGVVPCSPESLQWTYYNKADGKWTPISTKDAALVQIVGYGKPLTGAQMRFLMVDPESKK